MKEGLALMALHAWTAASDHGHGGHAQGQVHMLASYCWCMETLEEGVGKVQLGFS